MESEGIKSNRKEMKKKSRKRSHIEIDMVSEETGNTIAHSIYDVEAASLSKSDEKIAPPVQSYGADEKFTPVHLDADGVSTTNFSGAAEKTDPSVVLSVKMESFCESGDKIPPLVGYFPSGFDPLSCRKSKRGGGDDSMKVRVFRNKNFSSRLQLVVSPEQSKVEFVGTSYSGEAATAQVCTYALGVFDKEKQSLKIVPIAANKIFRLEPRVRGGPQQSKEEGIIEEKEMLRVRDLTNRFGTKQNKTLIQKWDMMWQRDNDPEVQREIESKVGRVEINKEAVRVDTHVGYIPPHDVTSTVLENAYPLDGIILKGDWDHLLDAMELIHYGANAASALELMKKSTHPIFVCNRVLKLGEIQDVDEKKKLAGIFSYITYLIRFKNLPRHSKKFMVAVHGTSKYHDIPTALFQKFVRMFVDSGANMLSKEKEDLLISYILVLTLFVDGFETDMTDISKDLKMTPIALRPHYRHLGCKSGSARKSVVVALHVPLQFPKLRVNRRR